APPPRHPRPSTATDLPQSLIKTSVASNPLHNTQSPVSLTRQRCTYDHHWAHLKAAKAVQRSAHRVGDYRCAYRMASIDAALAGFPNRHQLCELDTKC